MPPDHDSGTIEIREADLADIPRLAVIARLSPEAGRWTEEDLRVSLADPARRCLIAERDRRIVGFLLASLPVPDEAEVVTLAVDPAARRQGVGTALLGSLVHKFQGRVYLEVRPSNVVARSLYERFGFTVSGTRPGYYSSPPEDAFVMQLYC